ncbi:serine hydrolase [Aureitalea marina]|uniref:Beta-lactamase class A catalytic domain-containing protein n=1 Tax=Aureitalea marina TaxID=930804 RepID=A0A2S7KQ52_9FLAO|nr:serine hydrolase [Aureitalea marina]PQB04754.1 hypothetical protein BST85_07490 [Aureitalea marina]
MRFLLLFLLILLTACSGPDLDPIQHVLRSSHPAMLNVLHDVKKYEIQIIYTRIDTLENGAISFQDYTFRTRDSSYFYPASTVKFPVAVLALEYADAQPEINLKSSFRSSPDSIWHSIDDDVRQIFAVSDNAANNRLYELMGRDQINNRMADLGVGAFRMAHRLSTPDSDRARRDTLWFEENGDTLQLGGGMDQEIVPLQLDLIKKGKGFIRDGNIVNEPMDFSRKNYFPLATQHALMKRIIFPDNFKQEQLPQISAESRKSLLHHMHTLPKDAGYDQTDYYDSYGKFFLYGDSKEPIPDHISIYNKVGYAYGTLSETAFIHDRKTGIGFMLSATILVNEDGIFNNDNYEYDKIGIPFMAQLGRELYVYESATR